MIRTALCGGLIAVFALPPGGLAQDKPAPPAAPPDSFDLVFIREAGPVLLRLKPRIGDQTIGERFRGYLKKWFDLIDRNSDGKLDAGELAAPKATAMAQILRSGSVFLAPQNMLTMADLGKQATETVTFDEFAAYYLRFNVQPLQVAPSFGGVQFADQAGTALIEILDVNRDGKLSKEEVAAAPARLRKLDLNDDEMISAQELAPSPAGTFRPPAPVKGQPAFGMSFYPLNSPGAAERLPLILLSHYDKDRNTRLSKAESGFDAKTMSRVDKNQDGELDVEELAEWIKGPADFEFTVQLPAAGTETALLLDQVGPAFQETAKRAAANSVLLKLADAEISVQSRDPGQLGRIEIRQFLIQQFKQADKDERGYLEQKDVDNPQLQFLKTIFRIVDRNGDGRMTLPELQAFVDLQADAPRCQAALAIFEQGRALFQLLDANRDGRLSMSELRISSP